MKHLSTEALVARYNSTHRLALRMPVHIRRISLTGVRGTLRLMFDELHRRAMEGDNWLAELEH